MGSFVRTCLSLCLVAGLATFASAANPIVTAKNRFRIPFKVDPAALQRMNAQELRLYVSSDRGATWNLAQSINPEIGKFEYQSPGDGEFWFSVKTLDGDNQLQPNGRVFEPGLMVIVDTREPRVDLALQEVQQGKVQLSWHLHDQNLDPSTLKLEYSQPGVAGWQTVSVAPRSAGQTTWSVPQGGIVAVRGSVLDQAGNLGRGTIQSTVRGGDGAGKAAMPDTRQPIASMNRDLSTETANNSMTGAVSTGPMIQPSPGMVGRPVSSDVQSRPEIVKNPYTTGAENFDEPPVQPKVNPQPTNTNVAGIGSGDPLFKGRIVATRKFQLAYKIDDLGPSGISAVELFITQNNGQQWYRYGEDVDLKSPFDVQVPQDGIYGFEIRVHSGAGLSADPPRNSEAPSIQVKVDQTAPTLELLAVEQGQGTQQNLVTIRWRVQDANLSETPISLYGAASPAGPWNLISDWRPDTGSFRWELPPNGPSQVFVRVVARDAAGNFAKAESTQPFVIDLKRPSARIVDVAPGIPRD